MSVFRLVIALLSLATQCQSISDRCYSSRALIEYTRPDKCDYSKFGVFDYIFNSTDIHCISHKKSSDNGCKRLTDIALVARNCSMRGVNTSAVHCTSVETTPRRPQLLVLDYKFFDCECDKYHIRNCFITVVARNYDAWTFVIFLIFIFSFILLYCNDETFRYFMNMCLACVGMLALLYEFLDEGNTDWIGN